MRRWRGGYIEARARYMSASWRSNIQTVSASLGSEPRSERLRAIRMHDTEFARPPMVTDWKGKLLASSRLRVSCRVLSTVETASTPSLFVDHYACVV